MPTKLIILNYVFLFLGNWTFEEKVYLYILILIKMFFFLVTLIQNCVYSKFPLVVDILLFN